MSTLYHYCSTESLVAILRSKEVWLSSLSSSNDALEGRLVTHGLMRLAERDKLDIQSQARLSQSLESIEALFDGLGFCLSEDGDLLSQWRGYADDGRGVAIGFDADHLLRTGENSNTNDQPGFRLVRVEYGEPAHDEHLQPVYSELRRLIGEGAFRHRAKVSLLDLGTEEQVKGNATRADKAFEALFFKIFGLFPMFYRLKGSAFQQEREWRLVSLLIHGLADQANFRASKTRVVPYRAFPLPPVTQLVLGPRHETPAAVVKVMLEKAAFGSAVVRRSAASYR